jgi:hypothetical protein
VSAAAALVVALVSAGIISPGSPTPQPTSVPTLFPTETPLPAILTITITNHNCEAQDYYVDDVYKITLLADETSEFQTTAGVHRVYACQSGTLNCGQPTNINWIGSTTTFINRGDYCQNATQAPDVITITLTNNNCDAHDYYVDGVFVLTIAAGATSEFQTTAGDHSLYVCHIGTSDCGDPVNVTWNESRTAGINRADYCP